MSADDAKVAGLDSLGKTYDFGINEGTVGPSVIDVSSLYAKTGQFTYDPGFTSTASCQSSITYIDGEEGTLLHRGYPIEQLALSEQLGGAEIRDGFSGANALFAVWSGHLWL